MLTLGPGALTDAELLAILLRTGTAGCSALEVARRLLRAGEEQAGHGLHYLATAPASELAAMPGVGPAKAAQLKAAAELGGRIVRAGVRRTRIRHPSDVAEMLMEQMRHLDREHFQVIVLDTKNRVLGVELVSIGSLNTTVVHPREIFKVPIRRSANAIILVHNHPSGDPTPSPEDREVTRRLVQAGKLLGIEVLDHVVIGDRRFVSLRERLPEW